MLSFDEKRSFMRLVFSDLVKWNIVWKCSRIVYSLLNYELYYLLEHWERMYSESDTRAKFIDPQLISDGWKEEHIIREWYFTDGRKLVGNKRWPRCFADYLLKYSGVNLAILEAKKYGLPPTEWLEQVKDYGQKLHIRWVYSTNGQKIYEFDLQEWRGKYIEHYPTPQELYERYIDPSATLKQHLLSIPYYMEEGKKPRYYQDIAVRTVLSAIAENNDRILLTLATGTGKTMIAFQLAYKLFEAKRNREWAPRRPRILILADRNILVDQAMNTFNPIAKDCLKIEWKEIKKRAGKVPTNANIFFAIYQAIIAGEDSDVDDAEVYTDDNKWRVTWYFRQYPSNFFDLIIIDECHRWGANEEGTWREILEHFAPAVQLGLTATPKRTDNVDTYSYFGDPVYQYSLKEGINDGFLTPYKVKRIQTSIDELAINADDQVISGELTKDFFEIKDFDRLIIVPERIAIIAQEIIKQIGTRDKTIIFCVDQEHALRVRDAINEFKEVKDSNYCVRVTSNEGEIGRQFLEEFQDNEKNIPSILTSSQMLTTWVDARNVRNIVLLRNIGSMVEFKQIVWRGTRVFDWKDFFSILDLTWATNLFYDEAWDGEPLAPDGSTDRDDNPSADFVDTSPLREENEGMEDDSDNEKVPRQKVEIKLSNDRELRIINVETRYIDESGKPLSATEYLESLLWKLPELYTTEEELRKLWADPATREDVLHKLEHLGFNKDQITNLKTMFDASDSDVFDILAHLSFASQIKKRHERVEDAKSSVGYTHILELAPTLEAREFLEFVLWYYEQQWSEELVQTKIGEVINLYKHWNVNDVISLFGWQETFLKAWKGVQGALFGR